MSSSLEWHKFYFKRWLEDEFVRTSDLETLGAYMMLLSSQMVEGDIPDNMDKLAIMVGHQITPERFKVLWNEKELSTKFVPVTERWISTDWRLEDGYWEAIEPKPGRLHNRLMAKVMVLDQKAYQGRSAGGKKGVESRRSLEDALAGKAPLVGDEPEIDISPILKSYPKRLNDRGWLMGTKVVRATVTTQDDFDRVLGAVKAFAKETKTWPRDRIKQLDNFMKEWEQWVPKERHVVLQFPDTATVTTAAPEPPRPRSYPDAWLAPENPVRVLGSGERPPWIVDTFDLAGRERARTLFPDDASKRIWWMTSPEQNAGA
jgi:hypothetical protein